MRARTLLKMVRDQMIPFKQKYQKCKPIAIISAPSEVIEVIVKYAADATGLEMEWSYSCGMGAIFAIGTPKQIKAAKRNLQLAIPLFQVK